MHHHPAERLGGYQGFAVHADPRPRLMAHAAHPHPYDRPAQSLGPATPVAWGGAEDDGPSPLTVLRRSVAATQQALDEAAVQGAGLHGPSPRRPLARPLYSTGSTGPPEPVETGGGDEGRSAPGVGGPGGTGPGEVGAPSTSTSVAASVDEPSREPSARAPAPHGPPHHDEAAGRHSGSRASFPDVAAELQAAWDDLAAARGHNAVLQATVAAQGQRLAEVEAAVRDVRDERRRDREASEAAHRRTAEGLADIAAASEQAVAEAVAGAVEQAVGQAVGRVAKGQRQMEAHMADVTALLGTLGRAVEDAAAVAAAAQAAADAADRQRAADTAALASAIDAVGDAKAAVAGLPSPDDVRATAADAALAQTAPLYALLDVDAAAVHRLVGPRTLPVNGRTGGRGPDGTVDGVPLIGGGRATADLFDDDVGRAAPAVRLSAPGRSVSPSPSQSATPCAASDVPTEGPRAALSAALLAGHPLRLLAERTAAVEAALAEAVQRVDDGATAARGAQEAAQAAATAAQVAREAATVLERRALEAPRAPPPTTPEATPTPADGRVLLQDPEASMGRTALEALVSPARPPMTPGDAGVGPASVLASVRPPTAAPEAAAAAGRPGPMAQSVAQSMLRRAMGRARADGPTTDGPTTAGPTHEEGRVPRPSSSPVRRSGTAAPLGAAFTPALDPAVPEAPRAAPRLGLELREVAPDGDGPGARRRAALTVSSLVPSGAAAVGGLLPGDVITEAEGLGVASRGDFRDVLLGAVGAGQEYLAVAVDRSGYAFETSIPLGAPA